MSSIAGTVMRFSLGIKTGWVTALPRSRPRSAHWLAHPMPLNPQDVLCNRLPCSRGENEGFRVYVTCPGIMASQETSDSKPNLVYCPRA